MDTLSITRARFGILLVEDHPMFRAQLVHLIRQEPDMDISGEADNTKDAMAMVQSAVPDLILLDITLKGRSGLDLLKDIQAAGLSIPVLVLSMHDELLYATRVLKAGARGYISKHETPREVMSAIRCVLNGEVYLGKRMTSRVFESFSQTGRPASGVETLTDRELEVFQLIGEGRTSREIASRLHLGGSTVDTYRARIKTKLSLDTGSQLTHEAIRWVTSGQQTPVAVDPIGAA
jgi:DNA-binding NarL/FixJ family response regulator